MLDSKLQLKGGQTLAVVFGPYDIPVDAPAAAPEAADAVLVFATNLAELKDRVNTLIAAGQRGALVWLAYPKAKQLGTDLNRDIIHDVMPTHGLDAVRQIAIDDTWSALRFKPVS